MEIVFQSRTAAQVCAASLVLCLLVVHPRCFDAVVMRLLPLLRENVQERLTHSVRGWHAWSQLVEACNDIREVLTQQRH